MPSEASAKGDAEHDISVRIFQTEYISEIQILASTPSTVSPSLKSSSSVCIMRFFKRKRCCDTEAGETTITRNYLNANIYGRRGNLLCIYSRHRLILYTKHYPVLRKHFFQSCFSCTSIACMEKHDYLCEKTYRHGEQTDSQTERMQHTQTVYGIL